MIVEERTYVLHTEVLVEDYLRIYEVEGLPVQAPILGGLLGYFSTEIGTLNQLVHWWGYQDLEDRRRRRAELARAPEWQAFLRKIRPMIRTMENRILMPAGFSPIRSLPAAVAPSPG
jgi:hypothetical protein